MGTAARPAHHIDASHGAVLLHYYTTANTFASVNGNGQHYRGNLAPASLLGGLEAELDGRPVEPGRCYRQCMFAGVADMMLSVQKNEQTRRLDAALLQTGAEKPLRLYDSGLAAGDKRYGGVAEQTIQVLHLTQFASVRAWSCEAKPFLANRYHQGILGLSLAQHLTLMRSTPYNLA